MLARDSVFTCCIFVVIAWGLPSVLAEELSPTGTWKWNSEFQGQTIRSVLKLELEEGNVFGTYQDQNIQADIEEGSFEDGKLSFEFSTTVQNAELHAEFEGKLAKDSIDGTVSVEVGDLQIDQAPWMATRSVESSDVLGRWQFVFTAPDGIEYRPQLDVQLKDGELEGEMASQGAAIPVKEMELVDGKLTFSYAVDYQGTPLQLKYICYPRGDSLSGTIDYELNGNTGSFDMQANKRQLPRSVRAHVGKWQFAMTTPDGDSIEPVLTVIAEGSKLKAKLDHAGQLHEIESVRCDSEGLEFDLQVDHDGQAVQLHWHCHLDGSESMTGTLKFDVGSDSGVMDIRGTRKGAEL